MRATIEIEMPTNDPQSVMDKVATISGWVGRIPYDELPVRSVRIEVEAE